MKVLLRHTGRISMSIATLVIVLHLLIPHDHHQENFCSHDDSIPVQESHNQHRMPSHCHAFNDLAVGEKHTLVIKTVSFDNFTDLFSEVSITPVLSFITHGRTDHFPDITSSYLSQPSSLRAPPVIS